MDTLKSLFYKTPVTNPITLIMDAKIHNEKEILSKLGENINAETTLIFKNCAISEAVVETISKRKNVKKISFKKCSELTNQQVKNIISVHKHSLEAFSLKGTSQVTEEIWNILSDVEKIHSISLSDIRLEKRNKACASFLELKKEQIKKLSCYLLYSTTPADQNIALPNLEKSTWFRMKSSDLEFIKQYSSKIIKINTCELTSKETLFGIRQNLSTLSKFVLFGPQSISLHQSPPVVGIKKQTTQINAASMDTYGFSYFIQSRNDKACLIKMNMSTGNEFIINANVSHLTGSYGVMCSVQGNKAILVTAQQNERNTGETQIALVNIETNKTLFPVTTIPKENTIYDVQIGSFGKKSLGYGYAIEINSNNSQYLVSQTTLHVFPLDDQYKTQTILLDYFSPVENQGWASSTFAGNNELALIGYGSNLEPYVLYLNLAEGTIANRYIVPVDPNKINGGLTAITRVFDRKYALAVMNARGDIYIGPALNSDKFVLEASMGDIFNNATFYTSFIYVGNGIFAFYSETQDPYIQKERLVGFFDMDTKKKLSEIPIEVGGNCDFYMKRFQLLDSGKLGLSIVSRYTSDTKETTWNDCIELDIPKKEEIIQN